MICRHFFRQRASSSSSLIVEKVDRIAVDLIGVRRCNSSVVVIELPWIRVPGRISASRLRKSQPLGKQQTCYVKVQHDLHQPWVKLPRMLHWRAGGGRGQLF